MNLSRRRVDVGGNFAETVMTLLRAGIGLRRQHIAEFLQQKPALALVEVHSENYFAAGGPLRRELHEIALVAPLSLHGVGLSLGSADGVDRDHLKKLSALATELRPTLVSEHICWGRIGDVHSHDLLPLPYCDAMLRMMIERIDQVQQYLGRELVVENISQYIIPDGSVMPEWEFIAHLVTRANCGLLLDVNNVYVNCQNHGFDPNDYWRVMPWSCVRELHVAGFEHDSGLIVDTHSQSVCDDVLQLLHAVLPNCATNVPVLLEWDANLPTFSALLAHAHHVVGENLERCHVAA